MAKQYLLNEDNLPQKLPVIFSEEIINEIEVLKEYNQFEKEGLLKLDSYIKWIKDFVSDRKIAFDYGRQFTRYTDGTTIINNIGVSVYIEDDSEKVFVRIVWIDLNLEDLGLEAPPQLYENKHHNTKRVKRTFHLKESELKRMIDETVRSVLAERRHRRLNEAYLGDLYHFTTLSHLYGILKANRIYRTGDDFGHTDSRMGDDVDVVCCTRDKNFDRGKSVHSVRITLDGELMSSSLRNAKIHPYNYYEEGEYPKKSGESEERVYNSDIYPLNKYCKSIDIFLGDINGCDYYYCDDVDYAYEGLAKMGNNDPSDRDINLWFINHIKEDFPMFSNIIQIHGYNPINENIRLNEAVSRSFRRVLREHITRNR